MIGRTVGVALSGAQRLAAAVPRVVWVALAAVALLAGVYRVGHWRGHAAGVAQARHQVVQDSLEHNADALRVAAAQHDTAKQKADRMVRGADSTRATYQKARARVVVVDGSTVIDQAIQQQLTAPAVVELVRSADALKIQDSLTIVAVTGRAAAAEAQVAVLTTRVGLLEEDLAITREEHAPVIGRRTGLVLGGLVVLDVLVRVARALQ